MKNQFKGFQRELRKNMPLPEVILWQRLRYQQLGVKFRRQHTIGNRILDFYSPKTKLGIEIDGESHFVDEKLRQQEIKEDKELQKQGIKIVRFLNPEVMENLEGVLMTISDEIEKRK